MGADRHRSIREARVVREERAPTSRVEVTHARVLDVEPDEPLDDGEQRRAVDRRLTADVFTAGQCGEVGQQPQARVLEERQ
jgi:hypothetical protein